MSKHPIMVAVDGSAESDAAVRWAAREALLREADVTMVHVVAPVVVTWPVGYLRSSYAEWQEANAQDAIEQAQKIFQAEVGNAKLPSVKAQVLHDNVAPGLVKASREAEVIVVGSRGLGAITGPLLGSVSRALLHYAHCPVAVVHPSEAPTADHTSPVLVGIDGSPASEAATALAFDEASRRQVDLIGITRLERRWYLPRTGHGLARVRGPGQRAARRTPGRLAGAISGCPHSAADRVRPAGTLARRRV